MSLLLSPKVWVAVAFAAVLAALGLQTMRLNHAHTKYAQLEARIAEERARATEAARIAEQEAREEEQRRERRKQEIIDEAEGQTELAKAAAADAVHAADGLRERIASLVASIRKATLDTSPAKRSEGKQYSDSLDVLVSVLQRSDAGAGELALYADQLRIAGLACEGYADALRTNQ